jgi:uncharacterized BrkB/YihY/UPF0761 family membrane protein
MFGRISSRQFARDLYKEISEDNIFNGAAALAYYLTLSIFPAFIVLMSVLPYLPIEDVDGTPQASVAPALASTDPANAQEPAGETWTPGQTACWSSSFEISRASGWRSTSCSSPAPSTSSMWSSSSAW